MSDWPTTRAGIIERLRRERQPAETVPTSPRKSDWRMAKMRERQADAEKKREVAKRQYERQLRKAILDGEARIQRKVDKRATYRVIEMFLRMDGILPASEPSTHGGESISGHKEEVAPKGGNQ